MSKSIEELFKELVVAHQVVNDILMEILNQTIGTYPKKVLSLVDKTLPDNPPVPNIYQNGKFNINVGNNGFVVGPAGDVFGAANATGYDNFHFKVGNSDSAGAQNPVEGEFPTKPENLTFPNKSIIPNYQCRNCKADFPNHFALAKHLEWTGH